MAKINVDTKLILASFIGVIVTVVFLGSIADTVSEQTSTFSRANLTVTAPAVNGTLDLPGRELLTTSTVYILNATNVSSDNLQNAGLLITTASGNNSLLTVQLQLNDTGSAYAGQSVNVSYDFNPDGYISNSGGRSIANLIPLFAAFAILVGGVLVYIFRGSLLNLLKR